ncbi:MAG: phosphatidate cytidylyltransferase [Lentisphaerae bacterium]|nr:phosphatidate cytidylyltransferase [Lentisphaerota bacterium]
MLRDRLRNGILLLAALGAAMVFARGWGALAVLLVVSVVGHREFYMLLDAARIPNFKVIGTLAGSGLIVATWFSFLHPGATGPEGGFTLALFAAFLVVFARQFHQKNNARPLETMAGTLLGMVYIGFLFSFFARLLLAWGADPDGRLLVLYMIVVVKACDTGAYFTGCRFGRHKLIPRISPAKSWEGCAGGVAASVVASLVFTLALGGRVGPVLIPAGHAVVIGLGLGVVGILGDLAESLLKRASGVKDSGAILPGLGGLLDVIDSLLPAAPVLYFYVRLVLEPVVPAVMR